MKSDRLIELLAKQLGKSATTAELQELEQLLKHYPDQRNLAALLHSLQAESNMPEGEQQSLVSDNWSRLQEQLNESAIPMIPQRRFLQTWMGRAAVWGGILLIAGTAWLMYNQREKGAGNITNVQQLSAADGQPVKKILPDGTVVWLNARSQVRYEDDRTVNTRNVYLQGEAYFRVKQDPDHPFIVHAGNISVKALGTEFNVTAYPDENRLETTLISGKVQVTMNEKPDQKIILAPHEKLTVINKETNKNTTEQKASEMSFQVQPVTSLGSVNAVPEVAWLQDKLSFQNEVFYKLAKKIERRYDVVMVFRDSTLKYESLTGTFENENIRKALHLLQLTTPFRYRIEGDSVFLNRQ
ncbi:MAG: FecR family protein [Pseudobacter sp.]|uniref:FecR family protein n=1 Tax=Pseudobacter sp. TaxID=2045420 RepID=UPI003F7EFCFD